MYGPSFAHKQTYKMAYQWGNPTNCQSPHTVCVHMFCMNMQLGQLSNRCPVTRQDSTLHIGLAICKTQLKKYAKCTTGHNQLTRLLEQLHIGIDRLNDRTRLLELMHMQNGTKQLHRTRLLYPYARNVNSPFICS